MVTVLRSDVELHPNPERVVARPFLPGETAFAGEPSRVVLIANRVLDLSDEETGTMLERVRGRFADRHPDLERTWQENVDAASHLFPPLAEVTGERRVLLGAFYTQEYTPEGAALLNPSMVPTSDDPDDGGFVISLRAIGEGHLSSVEFRSGHVDENGYAHIEPPSPHLRLGARRSPRYEKRTFRNKLLALDADPVLVSLVMDRLPDEFDASQLGEAVDVVARGEVSRAGLFGTSRLIHWLADSNYELVYPGTESMSERILLPSSPAESHGIEDARFVRFVDDDGTASYFATYTAWDGFSILPQLIHTEDFTRFRFATLDGSCARNKGMAIFPRRIDGLYMALGRHDLENLHVLRSDDIRVWDHTEMLSSPIHGWEAIQIGNCGSPIETSEGWLVVTHGVGPMRTYALGALLLDLDEPRRVVGRLTEPLLEPAADERNGYVPNVVYSCGSMVHAGWLVIPYGFSDQAIRVASVSVDELLDEMR